MQWLTLWSTAGGAPAHTVAGTMQPDLVDAAMRTAAVLACVIGLLFVLAAVLKRLNILQRPLLGGRKTIRVLETAYLGPKQTLALVQAGDDVLLIGLTAQQITLLTTIKGHGAAEAPAGRAGDGRFSDLFEQARRVAVEDDAAGPLPAEHTSWLSRTLGRFTVPRSGGGSP